MAFKIGFHSSLHLFFFSLPFVAIKDLGWGARERKFQGWGIFGLFYLGYLWPVHLNVWDLFP